MYDVVKVAVVDATENLLNQNGSVLLSEFATSQNLFEQLSSLADLLHDIVSLVVLEEFEHLHDVGVIELLENVDLVEEHAAFVFVHVALFEDLDGSLGSSVSVDTHSDFAESSLSEDLADPVVVSELTIILLNGVLCSHCDLLLNHSLFSFVIN